MLSLLQQSMIALNGLFKNGRNPGTVHQQQQLQRHLSKCFLYSRVLKPIKSKQKTKEYVHVRPLPIPQMVDDYNHFMNGVDIADQLRARFSTQLQSSRTWMPVFYYLLDTAIGNAYILSEHHRKSKGFKYVSGTHRAFREALIEELLVQYKIEPARKYVNGRHLPVCRLDRPETIHQKATTSYCGSCHFCRFRRDMLENRLGIIGEIGANRNVRQTQVMCAHCQVYLCKKCFTLFHDFKSIVGSETSFTLEHSMFKFSDLY